MSSSLLTFSEDGMLNFELGTESCQVLLRVKNVSSKRVMYKVKTTQPMWYFVRPNFDILDAGEEIEVTVALIDEEKNRYLSLYRQGQEESVSKHRFMVQFAALTKHAGDEIMKLKNDNTSDSKGIPDLTSFWSKDKKDDSVFDTEKESVKFKVSYTYLPTTSDDNDFLGRGDGSSNLGTPLTQPSQKSTEIPRASSKRIPENPEDMKTELIKLRQDYDRLIDAYYRISSEKERLEQDREAKKDELTNIQKSSSIGFKLGHSDDRPGFSLFFFLVTAIIAFFLGNYLSM